MKKKLIVMNKIIIKITALIVNENKELLLIKEFSNKRNGYFLNIVKGTFGDVENETLAGCAIREAKEEAGIDIQINKLISFYICTGGVISVQFNFLAQPVSGSKAEMINKKEQKSRGEDIIETRWLTREKIMKLDPGEFISEKVRNAIEDWIQDKFYACKVITNKK